jgi:CcmD family protein
MKDRFDRMSRPVLKVWGALAALVATCGAPAIAFAQQFEKVEGLPRQEIPAGPFVAGAYGFIWAAVLAYVFVIARGLARVERNIADLSRKLDSKLGSRDRAG